MKTTQIENHVNGVDTKKLSDTIDAIKENSDLAKFNFCAKNQWVNGGENRTTIKDFYGAGKTHVRSKPFVLTKDEPPIFLGNDHGANPVEYALTALAGCLTTSLVYHAAARGVKIDKVESSLEGDIDLRGLFQLDENVNPGYESIQVNFKIESDAPKEILQELVKLAKKSSPVCNTITKPTSVNVVLE
ncbi:MAG: OsmC family protein [Nitrosopumilaceae archaeon]